MSTYCFASSDEQYTLFAEACMRGWLAAVCDFSHIKPREECVSPAMACSELLSGDVCCITDEAAYQSLVVSAWVASYQAVNQVSEREVVLMKSVLKAMHTDEALAFLRPHFATGVCREEVESTYARYQAARTRTVSEKSSFTVQH